MTPATFRIGVDVGGTFTDCVVQDARGRTRVAKAPTTPADPTEGVFQALRLAAEGHALDLPGFLRRAAAFVHGSTIGTNVMIERTGAPTGLLTTRGHEDTILIGRVRQKVAGLSEREKTHAARLDKAEPPVVPRERIRGVPERVDYRGRILVALDPARVERAADELAGLGVEAIAIAFLWSFMNPVHERLALEVVRRRHPRLYVTASSEIAPLLGEYERTVSTVLNCYIGPKLVRYVDQLGQRLRGEGFAGSFLLMQSGGGLATVEQVKVKPILMLDSGPVGGMLGSQHYGRHYGEPNIICTDVGGTSFDVGLVFGGAPQLEAQPVIAKYAYLLPKIAIKSIGAGGGSLAWVDPEGMLRVGPRSAGAVPGPAAYARGGTEATVTDADLILGYLNPEYFLGGRMRLDRGRAEAAVDALARRLRMDRIEAACGIFQIANAQMADLVRKSTVERGFDPRDFILFAYGGAGPTHAAFYAADAEVKATVILADSTAFSAFGMLTADVVFTLEQSRPLRSPFTAEHAKAVNETFARLTHDLLERFRREGLAESRVRVRRAAYARYQLQVHELDVPVPARDLTLADLGRLATAFETHYERTYGAGSAFTAAGIELITFRADGVLAVPRPRLVAAPATARRRAPATARKGVRLAHFAPPGRFLRTPVYDGARLRAGDTMEGPAIIERMGDTVVIPPREAAVVDRFGNLQVKR